MNKHTPGPWYIKDYSVMKNRPFRDGLPETICEMNSSLPPDETTANFRLIAAAPDLFEALENISEYVASLKLADAAAKHFLTEAFQALEKAK